MRSKEKGSQLGVGTTERDLTHPAHSGCRAAEEPDRAERRYPSEP